MQVPVYVRSALIAFVVFCTVAFLAFGRVLSGEFISDDTYWIGASVASSDKQEIVGQIRRWTYRPVTSGMAFVAKAAFGERAYAWHAMSIVLHAANGLLLFLLLPRLVPDLRWGVALLLTLAFLLHPAGSEGVLWISAQAELSGALFILLFFHCYLRWRNEWTLSRLLGTGAIAMVACFSKETAIVLPVLVLAFELLFRANSWLAIAKAVSVVATASVVFLLSRMLALGSISGGVNTEGSLVRVAELAAAHFGFIWFPHAPPFAIRPPEISLVSTGELTLSILAFLSLMLWAWRSRESRRIAIFATIWGVVLIWPAYVVASAQEGFFNGRQAYIVTIAVPMLLAAVWKIVERSSQAASGLALILTLAWMAYATSNHAEAWRTNLGVFRQNLAVSPGSDELRAAVAAEEAEAGQADAALKTYGEIVLRTHDLRMRTKYLFDMARITGQAKRLAESNVYLEEALKLQPLYVPAWTGLGNNAWVEGRLADAEFFYRRALTIDPSNYEANENLKSMLKRR